MINPLSSGFVFAEKLIVLPDKTLEFGTVISSFLIVLILVTSMVFSVTSPMLDEKRSAIRFSHIKTYTCDPLLTGFYQEMDMDFKDNIENLEKSLPNGKGERNVAIKPELERLQKIAQKLGTNSTLVFNRSMQSFKEHVSKAHHSVLVDFIFPLAIKGITE